MAKQKEMDLFGLGVTSMLAGGIVLSLAPVIYGGLFIGAGVGSLALHFFFKSDKYKDLFECMGLQNKKGEFPKFKRFERTEKHYKLIFSLPTGLCTNDFERHKQAIEQFLDISDNETTKITYSSKNVNIEVIDKPVEEIQSKTKKA